MIPDFSARLHELADVIVRVGVNLQRGQRLLIAEPYEQQGVARSAEVIVEAVRRAAAELDSEVDVIWSDPAALRASVEQDDREAFASLVRRHTRRVERHVTAGGALLFLTGSQPRLLGGLPEERLAQFNAITWRIIGPLIQSLMRGATQWTLCPAPSPTWAALACADLPDDARLAALWHAVFAALRVDGTPGAVQRWHDHLTALQRHADDLNARRLRSVRYEGNGTDLRIGLPRGHHWCTAQFATRRGVRFVANLPTEEVFTTPRRRSAEGIARVVRPVPFQGTGIEGIELEFRRGRVVRATASRGRDLLERLIATDAGASRLGEVALLASDLGAPRLGWQEARAPFHHALLDENAANHIALGEAYPAAHRGWWKAAVNRSLIHLDLPLAARVALA